MWWKWLIFGVYFLLIPISIFISKKFLEKLMHKKIEWTNKHTQRTISLLILFLYLWNFFYLSFLINNLPMRFIIGGLILLITFYNVSRLFIKGNFVSNFLLVSEFIIGIVLSVYLIYIIPNSQLQTIIISVAAAIFGGLLTLAGVGKTIQKAERDKKEEERKKVKPIFTYVRIIEKEKVSNIYTKRCMPTNQYRKGINKLNNVYFGIKNSYQSIFTITKIRFDNEWHEVELNNTVIQNEKIFVEFSFNNWDNVEICTNCYLEVEDIYKKKYYYQLFIERIWNNPSKVTGEFERSTRTQCHTLCGIKEVQFKDIEIPE